MTTDTPLARCSAIEDALASGGVAAELQLRGTQSRSIPFADSNLLERGEKGIDSTSDAATTATDQ